MGAARNSRRDRPADHRRDWTCSGLAHPRAVGAARAVGHPLGVIETDAPPPTPGPTTSVLPEDVTPQQATYSLGLPVAAPATLLGFAQSSSRFFSAGLTSGGSGVF